MNLTIYQQRIEKVLSEQLTGAGDLADAMRYSTLAGGKRLRAALIYATALDFDLPLESADHAAAAIECIHAYSLIHDDLPAMDNDDLRRGKPSNHKAFNEATAILAGDALNTLAFAILAHSNHSPAVQIAQIKQLTTAAGWQGMVYGQMLDMEKTGKKVDLSTLARIHHHKTGALIRAALHLGALPSPHYGAEKEKLEQLGEALGIAYQMTDDVLDASSDSATLGKTAGKDEQQGKNTYVSLLGLPEAKQRAAWEYQRAEEYLTTLPQQGQHLREIVNILGQRAF